MSGNKEYDKFYLNRVNQIQQDKLNEAIERATKLFDKWNDVTGCFQRNTGYYFEIVACIEDAVKCGFQALSSYEKLESEKDEN